MYEPVQRRGPDPVSPSITVTVTLFADLRRFLPGGTGRSQRYTVPAGTTLEGLIAAVGNEPGTDLTAAVDGGLADQQRPFRDDAEVILVSPMEGGEEQARGRYLYR